VIDHPPRPSRCWRRVRPRHPGSSSHSRGVFFDSASSMMARNAGSFSWRANQSAKRGSSSASGAAERGHQPPILLLAVDREQQIAVTRPLKRLAVGRRLTAWLPESCCDGRRPSSPPPARTGTPASPSQHGDVDQLPLAGVGCAGTARSKRRNAAVAPDSTSQTARARAGRAGFLVAGDRHDPRQGLDLCRHSRRPNRSGPVWPKPEIAQ